MPVLSAVFENLGGFQQPAFFAAFVDELSSSTPHSGL